MTWTPALLLDCITVDDVVRAGGCLSGVRESRNVLFPLSTAVDVDTVLGAVSDHATLILMACGRYGDGSGYYGDYGSGGSGYYGDYGDYGSSGYGYYGDGYGYYGYGGSGGDGAGDGYYGGSGGDG